MEAVGQRGAIEIAADENDAAGARFAVPCLRRTQLNDGMHALQHVAVWLASHGKDSLHAEQIRGIAGAQFGQPFLQRMNIYVGVDLDSD